MRLSWQQIPSTIVSDLLCQNSFDGVVLDTEHGCFNKETLYNCIQVIENNNKKSFVRLTEINKAMIRYCLDASASGLIFSTIEEIEQLSKIEEYCLYPAQGGRRGLGLVKENLWGKKDFVSRFPIIVAQIETKRGAQMLPYFKNNSISYYMIGPYDLSASLGKPGDFESEEYCNIIKNINKIIPKERMAVHIPMNVEEELYKYVDYGMLALGMDTISILERYYILENI